MFDQGKCWGPIVGPIDEPACAGEADNSIYYSDVLWPMCDEHWANHPREIVTVG